MWFFSALTIVTIPVSTLADEALAKASGCLACHTVNKKVVGPSYREVAEKFVGQANAVDALSQAIRKGSQGVWSPVPMPPNVNVNDADARKLASWILSLK
jgi:cytochrome c